MRLPECQETVIELYDAYEHLPDTDLIMRAIREKIASETIQSAARFEFNQQQILRKISQCGSEVERRRIKVSVEDKVGQFVDTVKRRLANIQARAQHSLQMMITKGRDQGAELELDNITRELITMCINCVQKQAQIKLSGFVFDMQPFSTWVEQRLDNMPEIEVGDLSSLSRESTHQAAERIANKQRPILAELEALVLEQTAFKNPYAQALQAICVLEQNYMGVLTKVESGKALGIIIDAYALMRTQFVLRTLSPESVQETCEIARENIRRESQALVDEAEKTIQTLKHFGTPLALRLVSDLQAMISDEQTTQQHAQALTGVEELLNLQDARRLKNNGRRLSEVARGIPQYNAYAEEVEIQLKATKQRFILQHLKTQATYEHEVQTLHQKILMCVEDMQKRPIQDQIKDMTTQYCARKKTALQNHVQRTLLDFDLIDGSSKDENIRIECERILNELAGFFHQAVQKTSAVLPTGYTFDFESYAAFVDALLEQIPELQLGDLSQLQQWQLTLAIDKVRQQLGYVMERLELVEIGQRKLQNPYAQNFRVLLELEKNVSGLLNKVSDVRGLYFVMLAAGNMRSEIGLKVLSEETIQETLELNKVKIEKESRQLIEIMKSTALRLKAFATPKAQQLKHIVRSFQREEIDMIHIARQSESCDEILKLLETRKERNMVTAMSQISGAIPVCIPLPKIEQELIQADNSRNGLEALQQRIVFEHEQQLILRQMLNAPNDLDRRRFASALQEQRDQYQTLIKSTILFWISQAQYEFVQLNTQENQRTLTEERETAMKTMVTILNELLQQVINVVQQSAAAVAQTGYTFEIQPYSIFADRALSEATIKDPGDIRLINRDQVPLMIDKLTQQHGGLVAALRRAADEQFELANPYLADIQALITLEGFFATQMQKIQDHQILHFTMQVFKKMRTQISLKTFSYLTIKETIEQTRNKIISESQQLIESVQSAVCQLKKYNTKHAKLLFDQFDKLIHDEQQNQETALQLTDCNQLFKLLDTYKHGVSKEVFNNLADRVVYAMKK